MARVVEIRRTIGVDIGGTNIDIMLFDVHRDKYEHIVTLPTEKHFKSVGETLKKYVLEFSADALGIGAAVWLKKGFVIHAPNLPSRSIKLEEMPVPLFLENDANCFAIFAHRKLKFDYIFAVTIGTGIGSGIIIDGKIYKGEGIAGEIGHFEVSAETPALRCRCGGFNHLECYFSGWALQERYGKSVEELMKERDIHDLEEFDVFCRAVSNAIKLLDPSAVALGGRIGARLDEKRVKACIYRHLLRGFSPEISVLNDEFAVAKGACLLPLLHSGFTP